MAFITVQKAQLPSCPLSATIATFLPSLCQFHVPHDAKLKHPPQICCFAPGGVSRKLSEWALLFVSLWWCRRDCGRLLHERAEDESNYSICVLPKGGLTKEDKKIFSPRAVSQLSFSLQLCSVMRSFIFDVRI